MQDLLLHWILLLYWILTLRFKGDCLKHHWAFWTKTQTTNAIGPLSLLIGDLKQSTGFFQNLHSTHKKKMLEISWLGKDLLALQRNEYPIIFANTINKEYLKLFLHGNSSNAEVFPFKDYNEFSFSHTAQSIFFFFSPSSFLTSSSSRLHFCQSVKIAQFIQIGVSGTTASASQRWGGGVSQPRHPLSRSLYQGERTCVSQFSPAP